MTMTTGLDPHDIANLLGGSVRILYAESTVAVPDDLSDIIGMVYPYAPLTGWKEVGATKENFSYGRGFEEEGYEIQQVQGPVLSEVTSVTRTLSVSFAEFRAEILQLLENGTSLETIAAAAGQHAGMMKVPFGTFSSVSGRRWAFIAKRHPDTGKVIEPGGRVRGALVGGCLYNAKMSADDATIEIGKGELAAAGVGFTAYPDPSIADSDEAHGAWWTEKTGTIASA